MVESRPPSQPGTLPDPNAKTWAKKLFSRSVLKQLKWKALEKAAGDPAQKRCLDLGSDNGVVSLLFREKGGKWRSADLDPGAVESIRALVGDPVELLRDSVLPYPDAAFDLVVVVDMFEHVHDDGRLASEIARVLVPGGKLVVNVPHHVPGSPLRRLRLRLGLTDEKHGHVRPGYDRESLRTLLQNKFEDFSFTTTVGPFSEMVDILLSLALERASGGAAPTGKGAVLTHGEAAKLKKKVAVYAAIYPFLKAFSALDCLAPGSKGSLLVATASRRRNAAA
ncbi:MAG TPA: class I SAM-dependent methyltransferase [bacterium]|nr:class I SAM-dependent methyltransferase [bacterium]